ncbi:MAG TPA: long-chain-fatty-acid--CoA ligase [Burkholderiaceae bacterium]|nr:long-chain-fatty-acid--CoA ligase [Burkholderiaceae bacterium]
MVAAISRPWPQGVSRQICVPQVPLTDYLQTAARRYPDKPALVYCDAITTYFRLHERVDALAGFLQAQLGLRKGDRVLLSGQNCPQFVTAFYAILAAGGVVVPVNPMSRMKEVRFYASDSGARLAILAQELLSEIPVGGDDAGCLAAAVVFRYADALPGETGGADVPDWVAAPASPLDSPALHGFEDAIRAGLVPEPAGATVHDIALLPYTSGTTGNPKGCMHTHATLLAAAVASSVWKRLSVETVSLAVAPLFHMLGLQNGMNIPITLGATSVLMPRWNPLEAARQIERHRVTAWSAPPAMVIDLFSRPEAAQYDLSSLCLLSGGGAAMPEAVGDMLSRQYGIEYNESYGLTETASFLISNPPSRGKRQCLGIATQGVDARVVDPETGRELAAGETGELVVAGAQVMQGYWRHPEANIHGFMEIEGSRFLRTGDLVLQDNEGYFFMRDRLKRMINASGFKVWPSEVENAMYDHPAVLEACVIGVPDVKRGETVKALLVLKPEHQGCTSEEDVIAWCRDHMAVYKAPRFVEFVDSLPKSSAGKILWRELQQLHSVQPAGAKGARG